MAERVKMTRLWSNYLDSKAPCPVESLGKEQSPDLPEETFLKPASAENAFKNCEPTPIGSCTWMKL
jgi:hypothetical protein